MKARARSLSLVLAAALSLSAQAGRTQTLSAPALRIPGLAGAPVLSPSLGAAPALSPLFSPAVPLSGYALPALARPSIVRPAPASAAALPTVEAGPAAVPAGWSSLLDAARRSTREAAESILEARKDGVRVKAVLADKDTKSITEYHGIPSRVKPLETDGTVFRHYVRDEAALREILRTGVLKAGRTSYVEFIGSSRAFIKNIFVDLTGVFFTRPDVSSEEPIVMNEKAFGWVDFRLPEGVAALDMDSGKVLMIPGAAEPAALIPIEIVGSGQTP